MLDVYCLLYIDVYNKYDNYDAAFLIKHCVSAAYPTKKGHVSWNFDGGHI